MSRIVQLAELKDVKSGTSGKGRWVLHHLIDGNGDRYAIFTPSQQALFDAASGLVGKKVEIDFSEDEKGKALKAIKQVKEDSPPPLGTGEYVRGQSAPSDARRILACNAWNNASALAGAFVGRMPMQEWNPSTITEFARQIADQVFLDLLRKGRAMEDSDVPFMPEYEE